MSVSEWLREAVPSDEIASKVACSRLHYQGVDEMSKLNASCYGVTSVEQYSSQSTHKQVLHALEVANAAIGELRGRMASLEAASDGAQLRVDKAEGRTLLIREEVEARARSEQSALLQRIIVAETRAAAAERSAAEALAFARSRAQENGVSTSDDLSKRVALTEARVDMLCSERPAPAAAYTAEDARLERTLARSERETAAARAAVDELRSRLQRCEARADEEAVRADTTRERLSRNDEHLLGQRSVFDATLRETKLRVDDVASTVAESRERIVRTDQRMTALEQVNEDKVATLEAKLDALAVDHQFFREHLARAEEQLRSHRDLQRDEHPSPLHFDDDDEATVTTAPPSTKSPYSTKKKK